MRTIEMQSWPRREHFEFFNSYGYPHFGMCANVDLTHFYPVVKERGSSLTLAIVYLISRAVNAIPEFRYRIREQSVVEHETVHPGFTILVDEENFTFCYVPYEEKFSIFEQKAAEKIALVRAEPSLQQDFQDDMVYMTSIPWVSFTSFLHPMHLQPGDSIPRFVWGKMFEDGNLLKMPLGAQGHHALIDGLHIGRFYQQIETYLEQPERLLK